MEAHGLAILGGEGHLTDRLVTGEVGIALGVFEGAKHPHFQIIANAFHVATTIIRVRPLIHSPYRVVTKKMPARATGDGVNAAGPPVGGAAPPAWRSPADGNLKMALERRDLAVGHRERRGQVPQRQRVRQSVGPAGGRRHQTQSGADGRGVASPSGNPPVGACQRHGALQKPPCAVG